MPKVCFKKSCKPTIVCVIAHVIYCTLYCLILHIMQTLWSMFWCFVPECSGYFIFHSLERKPTWGNYMKCCASLLYTYTLLTLIYQANHLYLLPTLSLKFWAFGNKKTIGWKGSGEVLNGSASKWTQPFICKIKLCLHNLRFSFRCSL